jgi:hypothetical protein
MQENGNSELRQFQGRHNGETILVCGCGASLSGITAPERFVTIGVNDVGRLFDPDYLVVLNSRYQFSGDRFRYVENSRAEAIFSQLDLGISHPHTVRFRLGDRGGTSLSDPDSLPHTRNSPYLALCLAAYMGARRIALAGVDFTDNHFFGPTGQHVLAGQLAQIDREYAQLHEALARKGIEVFNLSRESLLTSLPKMETEKFTPYALDRRYAGRRVYFVNYRFLSCGTVFHQGLANAADELGLEWRASEWNDPSLEDSLAEFRPELLFVVHGRKFSSRRLAIPKGCKSAVWLLDEPYEVDDTAGFSGSYDAVFVNDASTLDRHRNARYLPVCYDPRSHIYRPGDERPHPIGFVGGANPWREEALARLARKRLLSYVVGGPWSDPELNRLCLSANIPADQTAELYRRTRIVVNLFRSRHHYNRAAIPATALNPRIYEALACGALVISESRPELDAVCPELPVFRSLEELPLLVERYLNDRDLFTHVRRACIRRLTAHTYANRLSTVLASTLDDRLQRPAASMILVPERQDLPTPPSPRPEPRPSGSDSQHHLAVSGDWEGDPECVRAENDGTVVLSKSPDLTGGSERGLVGGHSYGDVTLEFELLIQPDTHFVAKVHQAKAHDQLTNSYHLMCRGTRAYLARHEHVMQNLVIPISRWVWVTFSCCEGRVELRLDGVEMARKTDATLESGYCFLGVKGGEARLRNIHVTAPSKVELPAGPEFDILRRRRETRPPAVSIVTTVYDRVECLERCIQSVQALRFQDYEQIVVADRAPERVIAEIEKVVAEFDCDEHKTSLAVLRERRNDWGITPATVGLSLAKGKYICFLSDDNGYLPNHFDRLVAMLEGDPGLGFVYSSCQYDGRLVLSSPAPRPGRIDLGQPLFRRELFDKHLGGTLPFHEFGWDWRMIERFLQKGVRWKHLNDPTFIFRLAKYPHLMAVSTSSQTA